MTLENAEGLRIKSVKDGLENRLDCLVMVSKTCDAAKLFAARSDLVDYLRELDEFKAIFPGFENDIHGVVKETGEDGYKKFKIPCIIEE